MIMTMFGYILYDNSDFIEDLFLRLSQFNIVLVKILQCSSNNNDLWSEETKMILKSWTKYPKPSSVKYVITCVKSNVL